MNSIRLRLALTLNLAVLLVAGFSYLTFKAQQQAIINSKNLRLSYSLSEESRQLIGAKFDPKVLARLQGMRGELAAPHRMEGFSNVLQSYSDKNARLLKELLYFLKSDPFCGTLAKVREPVREPDCPQ